MRGYPLRAVLLALAIGTPVLAAGAAVTAVEFWRARRPDSPWFSTPQSASFADVISAGDPLRMYDLLLAGRDPNQPITVQPPGAAAGTVVSPLMWAVARQRDSMALLLLAFGARLDARDRHAAVCAALERGNDMLAQVLARDGGAQSAVPCPPAGVSDRWLPPRDRASDAAAVSAAERGEQSATRGGVP